MMGRLLRSWHARVAVEGRSMSPTLEPGEWLLADPDAYAKRTPEPGDLVLVSDPRESSRLLVKRVAAVDADGSRVFVTGDSPDASTDSRSFGPVMATAIEGRPWFRYWPPRRFGRVG
jgi:nickel-type superoxide dismutase maturation protease